MSMGMNRPDRDKMLVSKKWRSHAVAVLTILALALAGPGLGLALWALGLALAPPWTFLTGICYAPLFCGGPPLGLIAFGAGQLRLRGLLVTLGLTGITTILLLASLGSSGGPTGMTNCQPLAAPPPQVRYACVSTSSDDPNFRY